MRIRRTIVTCALLLLGRAGAAQKSGWADPPYKPLSQQVPREISSLPGFGSIEWTMEHMPFVPPGPQGGVSGMAMTAVAGKVCMAGGYIPAGDETADRASRETARSAWCYDPFAKSWIRLPDLPVRREYPRGLSDGTTFYVVGGGMQKRGNPQGWTPSADCFSIRIDAPEGGWRTCGSLSVPRSHMAVGRVGRTLVVATGAEYSLKAGKDPYQRRDTTDVFDLDHPERGWKAATPIPSPKRGWAAGVSCAAKLWVIGGMPPNGEDPAVGTFAYDPVSDHWIKKTPPPVPGRGWEGACYQDRYVILVGGHIPSAKGNLWSDLALAYDTLDDRWMQVGNAIPGSGVINDVGVTIVGSTIFAAGGEGPRGTHWDYFRIGRLPSVSPAGAYGSLSEAATWATTLAVRIRSSTHLPYRNVGGWQGELDVFRPRTPSAPTPTIVWIHGGGWMGGDKETFFLRALPYLELGFAVVNVEYRLGKTALAPAAVEDCQYALRWVFEHAAEYHFDPARIVVAGSSAGGHLALMTGMLSESKVAAIINYCGITDVNDLLTGENQRPWAVSWIGGQMHGDEIAHRVSPLTYVRAGLPPVLTIHGDADATVPYRQALRLHEALTKAGVPNRLLTIEGGGHGGQTEAEELRIQTVIRAFLAEHVTQKFHAGRAGPAEITSSR